MIYICSLVLTSNTRRCCLLVAPTGCPHPSTTSQLWTNTTRVCPPSSFTAADPGTSSQLWS